MCECCEVQTERKKNVSVGEGAWQTSFRPTNLWQCVKKLNSNSDVTEVFLILSSYKVSAMSALHYLSLVILTVHVSSLCKVSRYYWTRDCSCTAVQSGRGLKCCVLNFSSLMRFPDIEF